MLNRFAKMLLVGTSLAPALLVMAIDFYSTKGMPNWYCFGNELIAISAFLMAISVAVMMFAAGHGQRQMLNITKAKNSDKEVLAFLLAYLLPVFNDHKYLFKEFNLPTVAILVLMCVAVYHSNAFDFNPLLGLLGYHFYEIEDGDNFPYLLISRPSIRRPCAQIEVIQLFDYTFLAVRK